MYINKTLKEEFVIINVAKNKMNKGSKWMPWRYQAKKDVVNCDKPRGAVSSL